MWGERSEKNEQEKKRQFKIMSHLGAVKTQTFHFLSCPLKFGERKKKIFPSLKQAKKWKRRREKVAEMMRTAKCFEYAGLDLKIFYASTTLSLPPFIHVYIY